MNRYKMDEVYVDLLDDRKDSELSEKPKNRLEETCIKLFERCTKDIESLFSIREREIRIVPNGDGIGNQDSIKVFVCDERKWKPFCEIYPLKSKVKFNKDYSALKLFDYVKKQLKHYQYRDIEESEFYDPSKSQE